MSSATISKDSKLYSRNELTPILNTADLWIDMSDSSYYTLTSATSTRINTITDKSINPKTITKTGNVSFDPMRGLIRPLGTAGSDYLRVTMSTPTGSGFSETIIVVGYINAGTGGAILGGSSGTANSGGRILRIASTGALYGRIGSVLAATTSAIDIGKMFVLSVVCFNGVATFYYNGVFNGSTAITAPTLLETTQDILRGNGASYVMRGGIGELLIFNSAVPTGQIQQIEYYLFNKWKIDLGTVISSPLSISGGVDLWLDGNDASTLTFSSGTSVSQWNDKSGNNRHATQATVSKQPIYDSTTKALAYSIANATSLSSTCPYSTTETIFVVVNVPSTVAIGTIIGSTSSARGREFRGGTNRARITNNGTIIFTSFNISLADADKHVISFISDASNTYSTEMNINYIQDTDQSFIGFTSGSFTNLIGGSYSATGSFGSNIYEVIICNRVLPYADRASITKYLYNKWNLTKTPVIPPTHTYVSIPPFTRPFNPLDIDNCGLWLDAADSTTVSGSTVTQWTDKSPNNYNATTLNIAPTYSNNAVNFSGTQGLTTSLTASSNTETGFFVFGSTDMTATNTLVGGASSTGGRQFRAPGDLQTVKQDSTGVLSAGSPPLLNNVKYLAEYVNNGTTLTHYLNGTVHKSGASAAYTAGILTTIGLRSGNIEGLKGYINEMIIYNRGLGTNERQQIETYLAQKWGLINSLPGHLGRSGNYLSINPTTVASNCALWLDANDPSNTGILPANLSTLSTWVDKSGNGRNAVAGGTGPTFYTAGLNSKPSLLFSSNSLVSSGWNLAPSRQFAWFIVVNVTATTNAYQRVLIANGGQYFSGFFGTYANTNNLLGIAGSTTFSAPVTTGTANPGIGTFAFGTSEFGSNIGAVNTNGAITVQSTGNTGTIGSNGVEIGFETGNAGAAFTGYISEIICYNGDVTQFQRQTIEAYLAQKWGLVSYLPTNHNGRMYKPLTVGFDPRQIGGCSLWLDALDQSTVSPSTNGSTVTTWFDKSGNGYNATGYNNTSTYNTSGLAAGYPGLEFSSTKSMRSLVAAGTFASAAVGFVVYKFTGSVNLSAAYGLVSRPVSSANGIGTPFDMFSFNGASYRNIGNGTNYTVSTAAPNYITNTSPTIYNFSIASTATTTWNESVNGTTATLTTSGGSGAAYGDTGTNNLLIGGRMDIAVYFQGVISEVIFYNTTLSAINRQRVEGYLAHKWGLQSSLPSTHPYKKIRP